ncbi:MAG: hypothetical protein PF638_12940 [Candidatus Delongbacteria bacterium]|jgi:hypothetical protein|nr:hypothetical protein [Candidatus Delongbacteria bacterium]
MKHLITLSMILISLTFISCDTDYSGEVSDTFKMYYGVEANDSSTYSLEFYVNNTGGIISLDNLSGNYISDSLVMNVTDADSFYMELKNIDGDTLDMRIIKGAAIHKFLNVKDTGEFVIQGNFDD